MEIIFETEKFNFLSIVDFGGEKLPMLLVKRITFILTDSQDKKCAIATVCYPKLKMQSFESSEFEKA